MSGEGVVSPSIKSLSFEYKFTSSEVAALAKFLRVRSLDIPDELLNFTRAVEDAVYDTMSIQEAEHFYC